MPSARQRSSSRNFTRLSRSLIERSMQMRCEAYLANAKHKLLLQTIMELDSSKRHLVETNQHLREMDRVKTLFIAGLTHEINNPLSSIIGYTELMMLGLGGPLTEKQQQYMSNVSASAEHLKGIVTDALDISKIESNVLEPHYSSFPLQQLVDEALCLVSQRAEAKGLELRVEPFEEYTLFSDYRRLLQCLTNLFTNAIKYTRSGHITLTIRKAGTDISLTVCDTGIGLSREEQQQLFTAFKRTDSARRSKELGSGIGLYLTQKLLHNILQGHITVESELGKGSCFTITIPRSVS